MAWIPAFAGMTGKLGARREDMLFKQTLAVLWDVEGPEEFVEKLKATIRSTLPEARQRDD